MLTALILGLCVGLPFTAIIIYLLHDLTSQKNLDELKKMVTKQQ